MKSQGKEEATGQAKITKVYNLPCKYVLHTVGPIVYGGLTKQHENQLADCYNSCLVLADKNGLQSLAFCCISTGEFHFPNERAAEIAVRTVAEYKARTDSNYFADFHAKYGITDMYSGGFYPYGTLEEYWAWWSRHIYYNRYVEPPKPVYNELYELVKNKDYFVITTNVDHCFQRAGFDKERLFYTQGDYGLLQCSVPCHNGTYDNEELIRRMVAEQRDMKIPAELILPALRFRFLIDSLPAL